MGNQSSIRTATENQIQADLSEAIMVKSTKIVQGSQALNILAFSDVHGAYSAVASAIRRAGSVDLVLIAGDLTTNGSWADAEMALDILQAERIPLLVVAGNMDPPPIDTLFHDRGISLNARGCVVGPAGFFGASASPFSPLHTPNEVSEEEILRRAESGWEMVKEAATHVFVSHAPPAGTHLDRVSVGKHAGSTAVRDFVDARQPDVVVCGHIHEARGIEHLGKSTVVNCGPAGKGSHAFLRYDGTWAVELRS